MKRIIVVRAGALGDVILTFPAMAELRRQYPGARITVVGYPRLWETAGELIDDVASIDERRFAGLFTGAPDEDLAGWLQGADLVVAWTLRDPSESLRAAGVPRVIHASPYPPPGVHAAAWLVASVRSAERAVDLRGGLGSEGNAPIFIHPGAGASWKCWPAERFAVVADRLREHGFPVVLVEGPADEETVRTVQKTAGRPFPVLRGLSLSGLVAELRGRLFIGNDSGVTHLAAWLGLPTIALFGPTDPASWAPLGDVRVLRACTRTTARQGEIRVCDDPDCMRRLPVNAVLDTVLGQE